MLSDILLNAPLPTNLSIQTALLPKTVIHKKLNKEGTSNTAIINSRMVRPFDILAINKPTNGAQEIHQAQYIMVQPENHS